MGLFDNQMTRKEYEQAVASTREQRMQWWTEARFGMFVHYSIFALSGKNEWFMGLEGYSPEEYEREFASRFHPRKGCAYEWAKLAKEAGCKYMVLTTRHHEGYSLWDSDANPYNVVKFGGDYDVVAEYVDACRQNGLKVGLYHSIMDWHNPDGAAAAWDYGARTRFIKYHRDMLTELMTRYGKIDILWYDCDVPFAGEIMDFVDINRTVRKLQPDIVINPRSLLHEDMDTPEGKIDPSQDAHWESCMTFNGLSWTNVEESQAAPYSYNAQQIIRMLGSVCKGGGNLLLNIGPSADGSVPNEAIEPLRTVGKWLEVNGDAVYGKIHSARAENLDSGALFWFSCGDISVRENKVYAWNYIWGRGGRLRITGIMTKVTRVRCLADGRDYPFTQDNALLVIDGLPSEIPDKIASVTVLEITCTKNPRLIAVPYATPMLRLTKIPDIEE